MRQGLETRYIIQCNCKQIQYHTYFACQAFHFYDCTTWIPNDNQKRFGIDNDRKAFGKATCDCHRYAFLSFERSLKPASACAHTHSGKVFGCVTCRRLTWTLKTTGLQKITTFQGAILRVHVSLPECKRAHTHTQMQSCVQWQCFFLQAVEMLKNDSQVALAYKH